MILEPGSSRIRPMHNSDRRHQSRPLDYQTLVADFSARVYRQALRILGSPQDAEDATQEVFLKVYTGFESFRGDAEISTWIYRITFNVCVTMRQKRRSTSVALSEPEVGSAREIPNPDAGPDEALATRDRLELLERLIARLPEREAAAITLFYTEQKSYEEISRILDIPPGSVATALHNGRRRLKNMVKEKSE